MNLIKCLQKDIKEYFRTGKIFIFTGTLLGLSILVVFTTWCVPILGMLMKDASPEIVRAFGYMEQIINELVPTDVMNNIGFWAADVGLFYTVVIAIVCSTLLPNEIKNGKWIIPLNCGYKPWHFVLSKCLVYGIGTAVAETVVQCLYYAGVKMALLDNYSFADCLAGALLFGSLCGCVTVLTILTSVCSKHSAVSCAGVMFCAIVLPDVFLAFDMCEWLPTYLFTFAYNSGTDYASVVIPWVIMIALTVCAYVVAIWRVKSRRFQENMVSF